MTIEELKKEQEIKRKRAVNDIVKDKCPKKIIVAGPGSGKTFTFGKIIDEIGDGNVLVLTFIKKLVDEMIEKFGKKAEVKTFHGFCKKILHKEIGEVNIFPNLDKFIIKDAELLDNKIKLDNVRERIRNLVDPSDPTIKFYLERSDYYNALSFDDSIYRLCQAVKSGKKLPNYDQIIVDEFQDFNYLEVSLIEELEKCGDILIAGDDDQAIYNKRSSHPKYLRNKYYSGDFKKFDLPYCGRCTYVIVEAVKAIIKKARALKLLDGRIEKPYDCYLPDKCDDSKKYKKINTVTTKKVSSIPKYIHEKIEEIVKKHSDDIAESHREEYPTVLIIGNNHYLRIVNDYLIKHYKNITIREDNEDENISDLVSAYKFIIDDNENNLGWRILIDSKSKSKIKNIIENSLKDKKIFELIEEEFIKKHLDIAQILKTFKVGNPIDKKLIEEFGEGIANELLESFIKNGQEISKTEIDEKQPSILLSTFQGSKGLSGGHVFVLNMNDEEIPGKNKNLDIEVSKFIVAITRTRKKCYLISNWWYLNVKDKKDKWITKKTKSRFIDWIPSKYLNNEGMFPLKK